MTAVPSRFAKNDYRTLPCPPHFLTLSQETLDEWQACQRTWMYLESIFGSPDIVRQLPAAAKMFQAVDKSWRHIMVLTADEPLAIKQVGRRVYLDKGMRTREGKGRSGGGGVLMALCAVVIDR